MAEDYVLQTKITADSAEFQKNLGQAQKSIKKFSTDLQSTIGLLGNLFVVSTMKNFAKTAISSVQETNKQLKLLDATLKTTGADAWTSQNKLLGMAQGFEKSSNYSKEQIMEMQAVLLGFKSVTNDVFESASQEIINMATVMGMDLKSAVQTVGKALDDPIAGLGSLSRQGFVFDESQKQLLKTMVAVGDKASAQKIILEELSTTYGGAAEASVDSFRGLELSLGDLQSAIGEVLIPMASELADKVKTLVNVFNGFSQGTKTAIVKVTGLVTVLPLVVKGLGAVKGAVLALKAANPVLLGVSAAVAGILLAVGKITSVITSTQYTATELNDKTEKLLGTYSKGNESKKLDAKTTQELIKLYPELSGKVEAYATTVKEAAEMQKKLNDEKIVTEAQAKISEIDTLANKYQWWKSQVEDVKKSITGLQNAIQQSPKSGLNVDRQMQIEAYKNRLLDLQVGMETAKNKVDEKVSEINKSLATVGKTLQGRSIVNLPEIKEQIDSDLSNVADSAKKSWRQLLADVLSVDIKLFNTGKEASRLYIKGIESELSLNKDIAKALGDLFNPKDELEKQAKDIKEAIGKILSEKNVDIPFSVAELTKQGTALGDLATKYKSLTATIKSLNIDEEIKDLEKQVANLGKSEIEVYKAELKANGATDEQIKKAVELKEKLINGNKSISQSFSDLKKKWENDAKDWTDVAESTTNTMGKAFGDTFEKIGESLVDNGIGYEDFASIAVEALADVLKALAAQITALGVTHALAMDYAGAALAAAGAAAALVAAGTLKAVASNMKKSADSAKKMSDELKTSVESVEEFKERLENIWSGSEVSFGLGKSVKATSDEIKSLESDIASYQKQIEETTDMYKDWIEVVESTRWARAHSNKIGSRTRDLSWMEGYAEGEKAVVAYESATANLSETQKKLALAYKTLNKSLTSTNDAFVEKIQNLSDMKLEYETLYGSINGFTSAMVRNEEIVSKYASIVRNEQLAKTRSLLTEVYEEFANYGLNIGETLMSNIVNGASKSDFLSEMKDYIRNQMLKLTIYTEAFTDQIANIGIKLISAMTQETSVDMIEGIKNELSDLFDEAEKKAMKVESVLTDVFGEITDSVEETTEAIEEAVETLTSFESMAESFFESISDLGGDIASQIIDGLSEGLSQSDFLSNMKEWLRKMLVQSVVYTETMKTEIEEIGKRISEGITTGFTDTSLHEIRRDLSYIFESASSKMSNIDNILSGVFDGYATGTNSALKGLHIVGEAGPELVNFRGGERVYNNADTMKMLSGSGEKGNTFNVTFNNLQDTSAYTMMSQLRDYNRHLAINGIL